MSVYFASAGDRVKIGLSENVESRLRALRTTCADTITLLRTMDGGRDLERRLHRHYEPLRITREWFAFCPTMLTIAVGDLCVPKRSREMPSSGGRILLVPSDVEDAAAKLGLSMAQVCRKAGVAPSTFSRWKAGLTSPTLDICHRWLAVVEPNQ